MIDLAGIDLTGCGGDERVSHGSCTLEHVGLLRLIVEGSTTSPHGDGINPLD
jgi:hypothetical protein